MTSPTPEQVFGLLLSELSASGDIPLTASTNTVPAPNLTLREAIQAVLWVTNAAVDLLGTGNTYGDRPWPLNVPDTILGHVLSLRVETVQTLALATALCEAAKIDITSVLASVQTSINTPLTGG